MSEEEYSPNSMNAVLSRIETNQKADSAKLDAALAALKDQENRIKHLEQYKYWLMGAIVTATFALEKLKDFFKDGKQ